MEWPLPKTVSRAWQRSLNACDDDQIVPPADSGAPSAKLVKNAQLKVYPGFPHGMPVIHADPLNPDLLAFIKA